MQSDSRVLYQHAVLIVIAVLLGAGCERTSGPPGTDEDGDGFLAPSSGGSDCDDANPAIHPDATETCDGIDNDCDGDIDEGVQTLYYVDADGDGSGATTASLSACSPPSGYVAASGDCDDTDPQVYPGATERCDSTDGSIAIDNDCDGLVDNGAVDSRTFYADQDGDGYGAGASTVQGCAPPPGFVESPGDCDDTDPSTHEGAIEVCDGHDNDCDGQSDEGWDLDTDGTPDCLATERCDGVDNTADGRIDEGFDKDGDGYTPVSCDCAPNALPTCGLDCDDDHATAYPGAMETCDGLDNDCDGEVDEPDATGTSPYFLDADGDGYGDADVEIQACSKPDGYSSSSLDCDDSRPDINPTAQEICDGVDNDCDGNPEDEDAIDATTWYLDADEDTFGDPAGAVQACDNPSTPESTYVLNDSDCDDTRTDTYPGAVERLDGRDNDCDGSVDEDLFSRGLSFDGADDFVQVPPDAAPAVGKVVTLEAWVRVTGALNQWHGAILGKWGDTGYGTAGLSLEYLAASGTFAFFVSRDGVNMKQLVGSYAPDTGEWHHVAAVADGSYLQLFVDGALDGKTSYTGPIHDNGLGILVGGLNPEWTSDHYTFPGDILEVRVSDAARYNGPFSPPLPLEPDADTILLLTLDECSGQTVGDTSANGVTGFLGTTTEADDQDPAWNCNPD